MKSTQLNSRAARPNLFSIARLKFLPILATALIICLSTASACRSRSTNPPDAQPAVQRYELKGRVESLDFERQRVTIAHEEIKGYMDAMTMSFAVNDPAVLRQLKSGDQVQAALVHDSATNRSWLEEVKVVEK